MQYSLLALGALNFFMADVQAGFGPFLGVFLQAHSWSPAAIGAVTTLAGICGLAVSAPLGAPVDHTTFKCAKPVAGAAAISLGAGTIYFAPVFPVVAIA
jgi:hypothetical protein